MYAVVTEVNHAVADAFGCHDPYALVDRGLSYRLTKTVQTVLGSGCTHGISGHTTQAVTCLCTYDVLLVL